MYISKERRKGGRDEERDRQKQRQIDRPMANNSISDMIV